MFDFLEGESAETNCFALHMALFYAAAELDIVIPLRLTATAKVNMVDSDMKIFAEKVHDQGRVLCVLLDEMQAPVPASKSLPSDVLLFVSTIKRIVQKVSPFGRVACTGSAVLTLLSQINRVHPDGFELWGATRRVRLGDLPAPRAARAITEELCCHFFPDPGSIDSSKVYKAPTDCSATAARPALVSHLLHRSESVDDFKTAFDDVTRKLLTESETDAAKALDLADMTLRKSLRCLADGSILLTSAELDPFKRQLCEVIGEAYGGGLQAPYPDLFKRLLSPDGLLLVRNTDYGRR
jgi:hypothetical protein